MGSMLGKGGVVALVLAFGCGGTTLVGDADGGGGTGTDGGSASDGGGNDGGGGGSDGGGGGSDGGGGSAACPPSAPTGGSCPVNGAVCEYGNDPNQACNTVVICSNGQWSFPPRGGCAPPGGMCPATIGSVPVGMKCTPEFQTCEYAQGICECTRTGPGPTRLDPAWVCTAAPMGCPWPRPRIGSACSSAGASCDYGSCRGGVSLTCKNGYWQEQAVPCPL